MKVRGDVLGSLLALTTTCGVVPLVYNIYITGWHYGSTDVRTSANHQRGRATDILQIAASVSPKYTQHTRLTHAEVGLRFKRRLQHFKDACRKYSNSSLFRHLSTTVPRESVAAYWPLMNVSVDYFPIEKTGSTTWRGLFHSIRRHIGSLSIQKNAHIPNVKKITFLFVRDPYQRLLSAYVDKLFSPNTLFWVLGRYIVKNFRPHPSNLSLSCGHDVTFPEFVRYVIHSQETGIRRDGHFVPTHDHCAVCGMNVSYDYIGHLETLSEDMPYLLKVMQSPINNTASFDSHTLHNNAYWVLKRMAPYIKKCMSMREACLRLWKKWHIRGNLGKTQPLPVSAEEAEIISTQDFVNLSLQALARSGPKWERKLQKAEALTEAFATVPLEDRLKLQKLLFLDFELFGFNPNPESVFPSKSAERPGGGSYRYFDLNH